MSGSETDIQWFIARDGKQHGPVSDVELKKLVELAHLKANDLVWRQGFTDWRTAVSVFPSIADPAPATQAAPASPAAPAAVSPSAAPAASASTAPSQPQAASTPQAAGTAQQRAPLSATTPSSSQPAAGAESWRTPGEPARANPLTTGAAPGAAAGNPVTGRPAAGTGPRPDGAYPAPAVMPRTTTDSRKPSEMPKQPARGRGRRLALVATGLLAMTGAGAWLSSQYKDQILAFIQSQSGGSATGEVKTANAIPPSPPPTAVAEPAAAPPASGAAEAAPVTPAMLSPDDVDRKLQGRTTWVSIKQEFPDWYQTRVAEVARLSSEHKDQAEITRYLVTEFVQLRRENAKFALAASTTRHKEVASAFLANLKQLSAESGDGCYDFISKGETSTAIVERIDDPAKNSEIEAQMVAVVAAIAEGRKQPSDHAAPVKTDYDVLAGELGRLGWTQADMQLFANPRELAKAPRERVCNMLKDWFTAHLSIQDPSTQERLLFETLKPVVSG